MKWLWKFPELVDKLLAKGAIGLIRGYQKTLSPDHSPQGKLNRTSGCRFFPTCSEYARISLKRKGFLFSVPLIIWRLLRCNPWNKGGVDIPPGLKVDDPDIQSTLPPKFMK